MEFGAFVALGGRNRLQQPSSVRVVRVAEDPSRGARFGDVASVHHQDALRHSGHQAQIDSEDYMETING